MKVICTILVTLLSFSVDAQEINAYVMRQATYSEIDSGYTSNNISGNTISIEFFSSNSKEVNIVRVGHKTKIGTTFHDYRVVAVEQAKNKLDFNIVVANDLLGGEIALKYNDEKFTLLYDYNEKIETWLGFYAGIILNENSITALSSKVYAK